MSAPAYARLDAPVRVTPLPPQQIVYVQEPPSRAPLIITIIIIVVIIIVIIGLIAMLNMDPTPNLKCNVNFSCPGNSICDAASGNCYECLSNANCPSNRSYCDLGDHICKNCRSNSDCPSGAPICQAGQCIG